MKPNEATRLEFLKKLTEYSRLLFMATTLYKWRRDFSSTMIIASILLPLTLVVFLKLDYAWMLIAGVAAIYNAVKMYRHHKNLQNVRDLLRNAHCIQSIETLDAMYGLVNTKYLDGKR